MNVSDPLTNLYPELIDVKFERSVEFPGIQANPNLVVLVDMPGDLPAPEQDLLEKILDALSLSPNSVPTINLHDQHAPYREICEKLHPQRVVVFGVSPQQLQLNVDGEKYKILELDGARLLFSDALKDIGEDKGKKQMLWGALKTLFEITVT